jgi:hypothetical protein
MYWKTIMKRKAKPILEQTVTLYQFVALHYEYITYEELSVDKQQFDEQLINLIVLETVEEIVGNTLNSPELLVKMRSLYTQLETDERLTAFPQQNVKGPLHHYDTRPSARIESLTKLTNEITWRDEAFRVDYHYIKFNGYLFQDILLWCKQNFDELRTSLKKKYDTPHPLLNGTIIINELPKLLQLAIEAHYHFNWSSIELSTQVGKKQFKDSLSKFLKTRAHELKIPDSSRQQAFGVSNKTNETFQLVIKPDHIDEF